MAQFERNLPVKPAPDRSLPAQQPVEQLQAYEPPRVERREKLAEITGTHSGAPV